MNTGLGTGNLYGFVRYGTEPVGASLLANTVCQTHKYQLALPFREQARSHMDCVQLTGTVFCAGVRQ
ncbi:hypothetical protein D3C87_2021770 [compost metagenome]